MGKWAGLLSLLPKSAGFATSVDKVQWKDRKEEDNISRHLFFFCCLLNFFLFNTWSALNWSFLLYFEPSSISSDRHLVSEEFVLPVLLLRWVWAHMHSLTLPVFALRVSSEMKNVFGPAFLISAWISGRSPIKVCLFVIANVNTKIQGHLVRKPMASGDV